MKILLVHNYYGSSAPSGEDVVFEDERSLLTQKGEDVVWFTKQIIDLSSVGMLKAGLSLIWSRSAYQELTSILSRHAYDVAHFHNIYPYISPSAYKACQDAGVPVVQTLHNYKMVCANGMLLDKHGVCEICLESHQFYHAVAKGCYRNSRLASTPIALMQYVHERHWVEYVDSFIALTNFGRSKYIEGGLPADRIVVKPNFVGAREIPMIEGNGHAIFIGRLKYEKGVHVLMDAWAKIPEVPLQVYGEGPARNEIEKRCVQNDLGKIQLMGQRPFEECMVALAHAGFLVVASICYEGFPRTICEAFCCGKGVIAPRLGAMAELVEDGKTGLLFEPGDSVDLARKVKWLFEHPQEAVKMGRNARTVFEEQYSPSANYHMLMDIYRKTIEAYRSRKPS